MVIPGDSRVFVGSNAYAACEHVTLDERLSAGMFHALLPAEPA
jgi:hypothetical protein